MKQPFVLIPWQNSFLHALKDYILEACDQQPEKAVVIFPHSRPKRYLLDLFRKDESLPRPLLLPQFFTIRELFMHCRARLVIPDAFPAPARNLGLLDAVALLHRCVLQLAQGNSVHASLSQLGIADFFPWGVRLFALLEECFSQGIRPKDIAHVEAEVPALAAKLLAMLGEIHTLFLACLREKQLSSASLDAWLVAQHIEQVPELFVNHQIFLAGFASLNGTEEVLLRHLWQQGAHVCLHSDPKLVELSEKTSHWSCVEHLHWLRRWQARTRLFEKARTGEPQVHFVAAYDVHSQLEELGRFLEQDDAQTSSTAIVLGDPALLMPVLHRIPNKEVNISMGYPLERSPVWRLFEIIFSMQEGRREDGRYYWRSFLEYLRHPYLRALTSEDGLGLHSALQQMENLSLKGGRFLDPQRMVAGLLAEDCMVALCAELVEYGLNSFAAVRSPRALAAALEKFCRLLLRQGEAFWQQYPLDAESIFRINERVLPALRNHELADSEFTPDFLHALARECVRAERVAFEADPIVGIQIMGMLETRLLRFDRVFILDATDDRLPGAVHQDPLLPDSLRVALDLPHTNKRDLLVAHTLHRLLAGARELHFFWQEGVRRTALFEGKKQRSRFVEELLWRIEEAEGRIFTADDTLVRTVSSNFVPPRRTRQSLKRGPGLAAAMHALLARPLSPSRLNAYLHCPLRFAWEYLCRIAPLQEINEGDDPAAVGDLIHRVLHELFRPWLGKSLEYCNIDKKELRRLFSLELEKSELRESLPPDSYYMLELAGPERLGRFLNSLSEQTRPLALEQSCSRELVHPWGRAMLCGKLDRLDLRQDALLVLDYKTGSLAKLDGEIWDDSAFWQKLANWDASPQNDPLPELVERLPDVQLPCYLYLCEPQARLYGVQAAPNAAWVELREDGRERPLFGNAVDAKARQFILRERVPLLLGTLIRHMEQCELFEPREGQHCSWCPYAGLCLR